MSESKSLLGRIFTGFWHLLNGLYRAIAILFTVATLLLIWLAVRGGAPVHIDDNTALVLAPRGELIDQSKPPPSVDGSLLGRQLPRQTTVRDLVEALDDAATDARIKLAVLKLDDLDHGGMAQIEEISAAVQRFRAAGKKVYARGDSLTQAQYLLAASADQISLDPLGQILLTGLGTYTNYFKDALDKLGVTVNVFRVGEYKSAVEPFERNSMSPEARAANQAWLQDLWTAYNAEIAAARHQQGAPADAYIAGLVKGLHDAQGDAAAYAKAQALVDVVETRAAFRQRLIGEVGRDADTGSFRQVAADDYLRAQRAASGAPGAAKIALLTVEGDIVDGQGGPDRAGGDAIAALVDKARRDSSVKAFVVHVDSPGGSVTGAEKIRRALLAVKDSGVPVVVSMSSLAASGGYWISMDANEIWAHNTTITGSIGIFGMWPTIDKPLDKLGIHTDGVGTSPLAGALRMDRPMSAEMRAIVQAQIEFGYRNFIDGVAHGRKLPLDKVQDIARGRVWSGLAAKQLGLVDQIGDLNDAVASAAALAGIKAGEYQLQPLEPERSFWERLLVGVADDAHVSAWLGGAQLGMPQQWMTLWRAPAVQQLRLLTEHLQNFNDPRGAYAYCWAPATL